jgi:hypothetical protein
MDCTACQHSNDGNARFCSNCGTALGKGGVPRTKAQKGPYPHAEGIAAFSELSSSRTLGRFYGYAAGIAVSVLGTVVGALVHWTELFIPSLIVGFVVAGIVHKLCTVREKEYRALPGALDGDGALRCVHCGGRGLWKRTPYKSDSTIAACSSCKTELFQE